MITLNYLEWSLIERSLEAYIKNKPLASTKTCKDLLEKVYKIKIGVKK